MRKLRYAVMIAVIVAPAQAAAAAPPPVFAPANGIADPGVVRTGGDFYAFSTGTRAPGSRGDEAAGPWRDLRDPALSSTGPWAG